MVARKSLEEYIYRIEESGKIKYIWIAEDGEYIGSKTRVSVKCTKCSHQWDAFINNLVKGSKCPKCSRYRVGVMKRVPLKEYIDKIEINKKIKLVSIIGEYTGNRTRVIVRCTEDDYEWDTTIDSLVRGYGCPQCSQYGFNPNKPAYIYLVKWTTINERPFLKFGITNRDVETRVRQQKYKSVYQPEILATKYFENGKDAVELENKFKELQATLCFGRPSKKLFPDGYTETLPIESLQEALELFL